MAEIYNWDVIANNNNSAPPNGWPENMDYRDVNDAAREGMAVVARFIKSVGGAVTSGGSSTAYTYTAPQTLGAYAVGQHFAFTAHATSTGPATMNISAPAALGAGNIVDSRGNQVGAGDIVSGGVYVLLRRASDFQLVGHLSAASVAALALVNQRTPLTANTTYFVRTDGNDSNNGLADTSGGAFLTIQKAIDTVYKTLDLKGFTATIQVRAGTFARAVVPGPAVGGDATNVILQGDTAVPANVTMTATAIGSGNGVVDVRNGGGITVQGFTFTTVTSGECLAAQFRGVIRFGQCTFGACAGRHLYATDVAQIFNIASYSITGGAVNHILAAALAEVAVSTGTVTLSGTPAFTAFATVFLEGLLGVGATWSGSATGTRYTLDTNGVVTGAASATTLPGNTAGTQKRGSQYDVGGTSRQTIWVPASSMTLLTGAAGPSPVQLAVSAFRGNAYAFDAATSEDLDFQIAMPKSWDLGPIGVQIVWFHGATATNFATVWQLFSKAYGDGDSLDGASYGTSGNIVDTGGSTNTQYISPEGSVTPAGSPAAGDTLDFLIRRSGSDGADTLAIDANLLGLRLYYNVTDTTDA